MTRLHNLSLVSTALRRRELHIRSSPSVTEPDGNVWGESQQTCQHYYSLLTGIQLLLGSWNLRATFLLRRNERGTFHQKSKGSFLFQNC